MNRHEEFKESHTFSCPLELRDDQFRLIGQTELFSFPGDPEDGTVDRAPFMVGREIDRHKSSVSP